MTLLEEADIDPFPVRSGEVIAGKYRVTKVLGRGAMGVVFEAQHLTLGQSVALKFLLPQYSAVATASRRFLREARAASRIRSEYVARVVDTDRLPSGLPYIVMERLNGTTLADYLAQRGRLLQKDAIDLLLQAAVGIAEAHAMKVIHRDLKPANLFVTTGSDQRPLVKLLDFGISKIRDDPTDEAITHADTLLGSPHYMSPEQMRSPDSVDERSDIWSLGVILFELLSGSVPFPGKTLLSIFSESLTAPDLRATCPDVPRELSAVVTRCLSRQRSERYPSVAQFARAILPFGSQRASVWVSHIEGLNITQPIAEPATRSATESSVWNHVNDLLPNHRRDRSIVRVLAVTVLGLTTIIGYGLLPNRLDSVALTPMIRSADPDRSVPTSTAASQSTASKRNAREEPSVNEAATAPSNASPPQPKPTQQRVPGKHAQALSAASSASFSNAPKRHNPTPVLPDVPPEPAAVIDPLDLDSRQ